MNFNEDTVIIEPKNRPEIWFQFSYVEDSTFFF